MYEKIAWNNFCKTGNIESFMEYRKLMGLSSNDEILDENVSSVKTEQIQHISGNVDFNNFVL